MGSFMPMAFCNESITTGIEGDDQRFTYFIAPWTLQNV
jgi:hypothetical protein